MKTGDITDSVVCLGLAIAKDLPDYEYTYVEPRGKLTQENGEKRQRRPFEHELDVYSFPQMWGGGQLGFGGWGTSAMTTAQTTVVIFKRSIAAVYFGRRFAYLAPYSARLLNDVKAHQMVDCATAPEHYALEKAA